MIYRKLLFFIALCFSVLGTSQPCELSNGTYKVIFDKSFEHYPRFEFVVDGDTIRKLHGSELFLHKKLSDNSFEFKPLSDNSDSLTVFQKRLIGIGIPFYDVVNCKKDTLRFINRINLHVISHSGMFVRIN